MYKLCCTTFFVSTLSVIPATAQTTGNVGYTQIIDSNSRVVGPALTSDSVVVKLGQSYYAMQISPGSFVENYVGNEVYYKSSDCTGTRYNIVQGAVPMARLYNHGTIGFPKPPFVFTTFASKIVNGSKGCMKTTSFGEAGEVGTMSLNSLGFTGPFSVRLAPQQ